jgi:glycosyltransferase involved in cell wall biosynthesis
MGFKAIKADERNWKFLAFQADDGGCGYYRIKLPYNRIPGVKITGTMYAEDIKSIPEVMILQRQYLAPVFNNMLWAKQHGTVCIYEIDDDLFHIEPTNIMAHKAYNLTPNVKDNMMDYIRNVDALTVSTEYLATEMRRYTKAPVYVLPNSLDFSVWNRHYKSRQRVMAEKDGRVVIGWAGSSSHLGDFAVCVDALVHILETMPNVYVKFVGENFGKFDEFKHLQHKVISDGWQSPDGFGQSLAEFDIGIIPLADNIFNRSKSNIKFLEYSAMGIPTIASDMEPYKEIEQGKTGFKVSDRFKDWKKALMDLIGNEELRHHIGQNARQYVMERYDIDKNYHMWEEVLNAVKKDKH